MDASKKENPTGESSGIAVMTDELVKNMKRDFEQFQVDFSKKLDSLTGKLDKIEEALNDELRTSN
ncbi:heat shock factor binding protein [Schizosaccharomyces japonicus yFS275]|uniref:Heat shock factor binding protein n=1 Tax=Schizosaccharomyces japonicus (strain yFS275 / FY16936) TaxID=402676 RepID=B6K4G7_SCHJY|nr:heat shock factor binding protein [Schizosaccharomyces japonicus yFS275]EEB08374.1 heat shock factor binding protein [Schizosaccharomyces japonicus yFS275]